MNAANSKRVGGEKTEDPKKPQNPSFGGNVGEKPARQKGGEARADCLETIV